MTNTMRQVEPDLWSNESGNLVISLEGDRYYLRDEYGPRAEFGTLERALAFVKLVS